jgi:quercetin dioxygenase-like cupin family protein
VDGRELALGPGERITVPAGIAHAYSTPANGSVHFVVERTPAQGPTIEVA